MTSDLKVLRASFLVSSLPLSSLNTLKWAAFVWMAWADRKSTRLNSSHAEIYTLSLHDALPIYDVGLESIACELSGQLTAIILTEHLKMGRVRLDGVGRSEEHTSELQSRRDLHSFPTRRSSDL